ncbi:hypothetical protein JET18_20685 [Chryseobacterium sp. L7]|uniref:Uncharacterized protein n=1 Tax=Chryseobacterium endalhagicum TaxID=2797638 RepID=A0ABS1QKY5_9FLAO|nr:hypothetical protein [Chryseobacterium endalhagicum]MBL1223270.1 hypothetical protein [Chryseobacterium endalhagicum]
MNLKDLHLGNLEAVLFFNKKEVEILEIIQKIEEYKYEKKHYTGIDSFNYEMSFFDNQNELMSLSSVFMKKITYHKSTESIMLEYKDDNVLLSHFFRYDWYNLQIDEFLNIMNFYFSKLEDVILVIGFELSFDAIDFEEVLKETIIDTSQHPLYIVTKKGGNIKADKYISDILKKEYDWSIMDNYLKNIINKGTY